MACAARLRQYATRELSCIDMASLLNKTNHVKPKQILDGALWHAKDELPTRLAHRINDLDTLPSQLANGNPAVDRVRMWYNKSFEELANYSDRFEGIAASDMQTKDWEELGRVLMGIDKRHQPVATTLAEGFHRHLSHHPELEHDEKLQEFLDIFHLSRIGMRTTSSQHMTLLQNLSTGTPEKPGCAGIIDKQMSVAEILQKAKQDARQVCTDYYGLYEAPQVNITVPESLKTTYIPGYLWHISFEILKNSLRAIVETFEEDDYKPITVSLSPSSSDKELVVQISDLGGGIPKEGQEEVWKYMYTTATSPYSPDEAESYIQSASERAIMAGFGYGLPISRLYGRFCGGDLRLENKIGEGVNCFIHLPNQVVE